MPRPGWLRNRSVRWSEPRRMRCRRLPRRQAQSISSRSLRKTAARPTCSESPLALPSGSRGNDYSICRQGAGAASAPRAAYHGSPSRATTRRSPPKRCRCQPARALRLPRSVNRLTRRRLNPAIAAIASPHCGSRDRSPRACVHSIHSWCAMASSLSGTPTSSLRRPPIDDGVSPTRGLHLSHSRSLASFRGLLEHHEEQRIIGRPIRDLQLPVDDRLVFAAGREADAR